MENPNLHWIRGTYGLNQPAAVVSADALVFRITHEHGIEILTGVRSPDTRFEPGKTVLTFGGFVDVSMKDGKPSGDFSTMETVERETHEEIPNLILRIVPRPIIVTGPWKYRYIWSSKVGPVNT